MVQTTSKHAFISYSRKDSDVMRRIVQHLREQGIAAWVDNEYLIPGTPVWEYEIERAIINSFAVVVVLSPDAKISEWVLREITLADEYEKRVFPVVVAGRNIDSIPFRLVNRQYADMRLNEPFGLQSLSKAVSSYWEVIRIEEARRAAAEEALRLESERRTREDAERVAQQKADEEKKAKEAADRLAQQRAEEERIAKSRLQAEQKAQEQADRIALQEEERLAQARLDAERKAKADRLARQKAEKERLAKAKLEEQKRSQEEADRLAQQNAEQERKAATLAKGKRPTIGSEVERKPISQPVGQVSGPSSAQPAGAGSIVRNWVPKPMVGWLAVGAVVICALSAGIWGLSTMLNSFAPTTTPTDNPRVVTITPDSPGATEEPAVEPTPTEDLSLSPFSGKSLVAPDCDAGNLIKSIEANDRYQVTFNLCKPDTAFLPKIALAFFGIYPEEWIESTISSGKRTEAALSQPIGTGPYMVQEWQRGDHITFAANPNYWGDAPSAKTLVFRWTSEPSQRLFELESGAVDAIDNLTAEDYDRVTNDNSLRLKVRPLLTVSYIGMNNTFAPFDDPRVRQAIALGIDRQRLIDRFYPPETDLASHFTPCAIPNGCVGEEWYAFDPEAARAMLAEAGYPDGFSTALYYRDVFRTYLPQAPNVAADIQSQLRDHLNIDLEIVVLESAEFFEAMFNGRLDGFHLFGWGADFPHVTNFLDTIFLQNTGEFGNLSPEISTPLTNGAQVFDINAAQPFYEQANNAIRENVPMIPIAHASTLVAYHADIMNPQASPTYQENFAAVDPNGRDSFVWMQADEPVSLFCADELDTASIRACSQVHETLYRYESNGVNVEPALAESCEPNEDLTVWICNLRRGVLFQDGTTFDANDVITTFTMGLDASSPLHAGNGNTWDYYSFIWGLINNQ